MTRTIVVGGGAAGIPLAVRLSEDPDREVVLVEAGPAPEEYPADLRDGTSVQGAMPGHPFSWSYLGHLTPDRPYTVARGRVLGGSSAINGGYFVRSRPEDFARWARAGGADWSPEAVGPVWAALEHDRDVGDRPGHGSSGPMPIGRPPQDGVLAGAFTAAARMLGFPAEPDKNAAGAPGVGAVPSNVVDGERISTARAYRADLAARPNLRVLPETRVLRVRFRGTRAVGVETTAGVLDADEVVLCAGAIGTAHLLLASGVGPAAHLEAVGVPVVVDSPVGQAFSDHPDLNVGWRPTRSLDDPAERFAFPTALQLSSSDRHPQGDLEVLLSVKSLGHLLTGSSVAANEHFAQAEDLQLIVALQRPEGRGAITLQSTDPLVAPRIDYRYLEESDDRRRARFGIRTAVALLRADPFDGVFDRLTELDDDTLGDDDRLDDWMRSHLGTAIHMSGTAPMGPVVDGAGRVHGVRGLRVADTSMLPDVPSRGPFATAVFLGEHVGRLIRDGR
ncbi:mycofactocin dehydrogenase MftG [Microbacterium sp. GXF7504]